MHDARYCVLWRTIAISFLIGTAVKWMILLCQGRLDPVMQAIRWLDHVPMWVVLGLHDGLAAIHGEIVIIALVGGALLYVFAPTLRETWQGSPQK